MPGMLDLIGGPAWLDWPALQNVARGQAGADPARTQQPTFRDVSQRPQQPVGLQDLLKGLIGAGIDPARLGLQGMFGQQQQPPQQQPTFESISKRPRGYATPFDIESPLPQPTVTPQPPSIRPPSVADPAGFFQFGQQPPQQPQQPQQQPTFRDISHRPQQPTFSSRRPKPMSPFFQSPSGGP